MLEKSICYPDEIPLQNSHFQSTFLTTLRRFRPKAGIFSSSTVQKRSWKQNRTSTAL
jgi:hypothetical protein